MYRVPGFGASGFHCVGPEGCALVSRAITEATITSYDPT